MKSVSWNLITIVFAAFTAPAGASLVFVGTIPSTGNGIGAVSTSLTFQNLGMESGCVGFDGAATNSGAASCPSGYSFTGGDEKPGSSQTNVFTAADLNFSATNNFSNLVLLFNGSEGGNAADQPITLDVLGLSLYSSTGAILATFTTTAPSPFDAFPGVGNAGFGFALDATQAAQANALLAANPLLRIGTEANVSGAQGGLETIQLTTVTDTGVPEPSSVVMLASGLLFVGLGVFRRRARIR